MNRKTKIEMNKSFCVFIISHGRPNKVVTAKTLDRCNYTGAKYIVCDNEDKTIEEYKRNFGANTVLVFDKKHYASLVDNADNFQNRRTTTHARNACFDFAKQMGFEYFLVLDDDYTTFMHNFDSAGHFNRTQIKNFDALCDAMLEFLDCDERIKSVCFLQGGDLIGGVTSIQRQIFPFIKRKAMNSFFCKTERRFWFFSRLNEDVNTYMRLGQSGDIFLSIPDIALNQVQTQASAGGMSEAYLAGGTYVKSFYTTMICPSFAKVNYTDAMNRLHHKISWNNAVPKIICESHKKQ